MIQFLRYYRFITIAGKNFMKKNLSYVLRSIYYQWLLSHYNYDNNLLFL